MSHFRVIVAVKCGNVNELEDVLENAMEPFYEETEAPAFLAFKDKAEEKLKEYEESDKDVSFEEFCEEDGCVVLDDGRVGYYYNPNAKWDWYSIGGGFDGQFLVKMDNKDCIFSKSQDPVGGYRLAVAARMKDICWDEIRRQKVDLSMMNYEILREAFETGSCEKLGSLTVIKEDAIYGWGSVVLYKAGETLEEFQKRKGLTDRFPVSAFACLDTNGKWHEEGHMGWFGVSTNNKEERNWHDEQQKFFESVAEDDYLVMVDCHI